MILEKIEKTYMKRSSRRGQILVADGETIGLFHSLKVLFGVDFCVKNHDKILISTIV